MLPTTLVLMKSRAQLRHDDVQQVPGQERDGPGDDEAAVAPRSSGNSARGVQLVVDGSCLRRACSVVVGSSRVTSLEARRSAAAGDAPSHARSPPRQRAGSASGQVVDRRAAAIASGRLVRRAVSVWHATSAVSRGRASTASGVCSRTMVARRAAGTASRVRQQTHDHGREGERHVHAAGWASRAPPSRRRSRPTMRHSTAPRRSRRPPTSSPASAPAAVSRATRCRAPAAGRTSTPRPRTPSPTDRRDARRPCSGEGQAPAARRTASSARRPGRRATPPAGEPSPRPSTSWVSTPATEIVQARGGGQERRERAAATSAAEQRRRQARPIIRPGSSSTTVSVRPVGQVGGVDPAERAVDRRQQVEDAEQAEHDQRRAPGGAAVGVGVEADQTCGRPMVPRNVARISEYVA